MTPEQHRARLRIQGGIAQVKDPVFDDIRWHIEYLNKHHRVEGEMWMATDVVHACKYEVRESIYANKS